MRRAFDTGLCSFDDAPKERRQGVRPERGAVAGGAAEVGAIDSFERLIQPELLVALVEVD